MGILHWALASAASLCRMDHVCNLKTEYDQVRHFVCLSNVLGKMECCTCELSAAEVGCQAQSPMDRYCVSVSNTARVLCDCLCCCKHVCLSSNYWPRRKRSKMMRQTNHPHSAGMMPSKKSLAAKRKTSTAQL